MFEQLQHQVGTRRHTAGHETARRVRRAALLGLLLLFPVASGAFLPQIAEPPAAAHDPATANGHCLFEACLQWAARYNGPANDADGPTAITVAPNGTTVFVTGLSFGGTTSFDFATLAYDAATGATRWAARYDGVGGFDSARSVTTSPDGTRVYVTGVSMGSGTSRDFATIAYDAWTGAVAWIARYNGPENLVDFPHMVRVSPDGARVYVTGESSGGAATAFDVATVAYEATNGTQLWAARFHNVNADRGSSLVVSPDGTRLYVTGQSRDPATDYDVVTLGYDTADGSLAWSALYDGPSSGYEFGAAIATDPNGTRVFVAASSAGVNGDWDQLTLAYDAVTGGLDWSHRQDWLDGTDSARALALSQDGTRVYVTGTSMDPATAMDVDVATFALGAQDGSVLWTARHGGAASAGDTGAALAVAPDDSRVYVVGDVNQGQPRGFDMLAMAYDAVTGTPVWNGLYNGPSSREDYATAVVLSPDGDWLYATGASFQGAAEDYATLAFRAVTAPVPDAPRDLVATPGEALGSVLLSWSEAAAPGEAPVSLYHVHRAAGMDWVHIASVTPDVLSFTDTDRAPALPNHYRITAENVIGEGPPSDEACSAPGPWPAALPAACGLPVR